MAISLTALKELVSWLFGKSPEYRGLIMGFDAAGKTTLLYQLKLPNEKITTIPTIGFNVETVQSSNRHNFTLWDVGGCDKIRPLYRHYFQDTDVFFFVVDCADTERLDEVVPEIESVLNEVSAEPGKRKARLWVVLNKQDLVPSQEREKVVKDIRTKIEQAVGRMWPGRVHVFDAPGFNAFEHHHAQALLDDVARVLLLPGEPPRPPIQEKEKLPTSTVSELELQEKINEALEKQAATTDVFWQGFLDADLPEWNHHNHLRAGYLVLLDGLACGNSVMRCADIFLDHLEMLRSKKPERFRNTSHRTMTIFWLFQLQVAAIRYAHHKHLIGLPRREDFGRVLLHTPQLMDTRAWEKYYSKHVIFSPKARANWVLPDRASLPSVTEPAEQTQEALSGVPQTGGDRDHLIRFALTVVQATSDGKLRRGAVIKQSLSALQTSIMQKRASLSSIDPYSETQAYFWIQYVHAALASLRSTTSSPSTSLNGAGWHGSMETLTLPAFKALFDISGNEWKEYYSPALWDSVKARIAFVNPDRKPLPGLISIPPQASANIRIRMSKTSIGIATAAQMPPKESLAVMVAAVCDAAALWESDSTDGIVKTHPELVVFLHEKLVRGLSQRRSKTDDVTGNSRRRSELSKAVNEALDVSGPPVEGLTRKMFWIQQVLAAAEQTSEGASFDEFMDSNPHLAYEGLPLMYYSEMILGSDEAREVFIPPDRRAFASVVGV